ncbi:MAG: hypothetical protein RUDDFDWM_000337 [Candidatus Fervidibacterota bacterium]
MGEELGREEVEVDLFTIALILWGARKFLAALTITTAVLVAFITLCFTPRTYSATASALMPITPTSQIQSLLGAIAAQAGAVGIFPQPKAELYKAILESRRVREGVIRKLNLMSYFPTKTMEEALESLSKATRITIKEPVIKVSVRLSGTPKFPLIRPKKNSFDYGIDDSNVKRLAADVANAYIEEMCKFLKTTSVERSRIYREFIERRFNETKKLYEQMPLIPNAPAPMAAAMFDGSGSKLFEQYAQLTVEATKADADADAVLAQMQKLSKLLNLQIEQGLTPALNKLKERLQQEEFTYASLRLKYGEEHPLVREQHGRLIEARQQLEKEIKLWSRGAKEQFIPELAQLQAQYVAASARAQALRKILKQRENELDRLTSSMESWRRQRVELEIAENAYKLLAEQLLRAQMAEKYEGIEVEVLDKAVPPIKKTTPSTLLNVTLGSVLALMLGCMLVLASHSVRTRTALLNASGNVKQSAT